jgi:hypothetical protein
LAPLIAEPLIQQLWPLVLQSPSRSADVPSAVDADASPPDSLGLRLARGRHRYEHQWNNRTLEVPLSWLCRSSTFARFAAWLLVQAPRFWTVYNSAIRDYRRTHRLRSQTHPAPELRADQGWRETPFWLWTADSPARRPLWCCLDGKSVVLSDRDRIEWSIDASGPGACLEDRLAQGILERGREGVRVRPRALITTLFARLLLGDLFVHGVGGAQYDRVTNTLIQSLLEIQPPAYAVATATVRLPVPFPDAGQQDPVRIDQQLRELQYHAERFLAPEYRQIQEVREAIAQKQAALSQSPPRGQRRMRHQQITQANQALQPWVDSVRSRLEQRRQQLAQDCRHRQLLASREYAFCHFPAVYLQRSLERMLDQVQSQR